MKGGVKMYCNNTKCIEWDADQNGGHCMIVFGDLLCEQKKGRLQPSKEKLIIKRSITNDREKVKKRH